MNLLATLADNEAVTVRGLVNKHHRLMLKQGLIDAGVAQDNHQLHTIRDEMIIWDDEGNVLFLHVVNGIYFEKVTVRTRTNPAKGYIVANMNETKLVEYNPVSSIKLVKNDIDEEILTEQIDNNVLHFYRSDHPDAMPFMSISPLWLAVPEFQNLLNTFSGGNYSDVDDIAEVREPKCNVSTVLPLSPRKTYPDDVAPAYWDGQIA
jgi:hypothetical protein